jgi:hypothetical protein
MTIWRMRIACCIRKATDTHSEYVILNAFSITTMVAETRLIVTLYIHRLSYYLQLFFTLSGGQAVKVWEISFGYRGALTKKTVHII